MNRNRGILLGLLLLGAIATQWAVTKYSVEPEAGLPLARSDYVLEEFRLSAMDETGKPRFVLQAPRLERLPGEEAATVSDPRLWLYEETGAPWEMSAEAAWIGANAKELRLQGAVTLSQTEPSYPTVIQGSSIAIWPDEKRAASEQTVTVTRPGEFLEGRGMIADLASSRVELKADVKARYAPNEMDHGRAARQRRGAG